MFLDNRSVPPAFIVDAIPGAPELRDSVTEHRAALRRAQAALRAKSDQFRESAVGSIDDPTPRPGVTRAALDRVLDAYSKATNDEKTAQRSLERALRALNDAVRRGMATDAFKASHEALADVAQEAAEHALIALRNAIADRDRFDASIGRQRDTSDYGLEDPRYYLAAVDNIVRAPVMDDRSRAAALIDASTLTAGERLEAAKRAGLIQ